MSSAAPARPRRALPPRSAPAPRVPPAAAAGSRGEWATGSCSGDCPAGPRTRREGQGKEQEGTGGRGRRRRRSAGEGGWPWGLNLDTNLNRRCPLPGRLRRRSRHSMHVPKHGRGGGPAPPSAEAWGAPRSPGLGPDSPSRSAAPSFPRLRRGGCSFLLSVSSAACFLLSRASLLFLSPPPSLAAGLSVSGARGPGPCRPVRV